MKRKYELARLVIVVVLALAVLKAVIDPKQDTAAPIAPLSSPTPLPTKAAQTATPIPGVPSVSGFYTPMPVDGPATPLPENGALFFLWGSDLYTAQNDGMGLTQLAEEFDLTHFALAPDGQRIVFAGHAADQRTQDNVYVMNADGSRIIELVNQVGWAPEPIQWSPDSQKIVFQSGGTIYIVSISDGSIIGVSPSQSNNSPRWSPDSQHIVFESGPAGTEELSIMTADGTTITRLVPRLYPRRPVFWVPNGQQIIFSAGDGSQDYVVDSDGSHLSALSIKGLYDPHAWSPDGQQFLSVRADGLYKVSIGGSEVTRLVEGEFKMPWFAWSTDGQRIAFSAFREMTMPASYDVYVMNNDGGHFNRLLPEAISNSFPVWSPDGRFLLFYSQQEDETLTGVYRLTLADGTIERLPLEKSSLTMIWQPLSQ